MLKRKRLREKGKVSFIRFFQKFEMGDSVAIVKDLGFASNVPNRMQGKTGKVVEKRGSAYVVEVKDYDMKKQLILKPIHLKKIQ